MSYYLSDQSVTSIKNNKNRFCDLNDEQILDDVNQSKQRIDETENNENLNKQTHTFKRHLTLTSQYGDEENDFQPNDISKNKEFITVSKNNKRKQRHTNDYNEKQNNDDDVCIIEPSLETMKKSNENYGRFFNMLHLRTRQKLGLPTSNSHPEKKLKSERRCLTWINVALGALIPLMIEVSTIVVSAVNQSIQDKQRQQDQHLAYLRRLQDQQLADELYYQGVFKTYVEDISNVFFKLNNTFIDNQKKMKYIRIKTLIALEELDWQGKSRLFLFLNETGLLSPFPLSYGDNNVTNVSLDLSDANFVNISIKSTPHKKFHFNNLRLSSVDFTNASFIGCQFNQGVDFRNSSMFGANFTQSKFECSQSYVANSDSFGHIHVKFDDSNLERSDFSDSYMCDVSFVRANLAHSTFKGIRFQGLIEFRSTNLTLVNRDFSLSDASLSMPLPLTFSNIDFRTIPLSISSSNNHLVKLSNVILYDGTWVLNDSSLVLNGDAEMGCMNLGDKRLLMNWKPLPTIAYFPTLSNYPQSENASYGNCSFNFTTIEDKKVRMHQDVNVDEYIVFLDTNESEYEIAADMRCINEDVFIGVTFYSVTMTYLLSSRKNSP
ncbi:unnamed protein product [Rotaria socialis]|uniref:Pentapeptide repeat-containing protein n=2 Tax=Rotaria socialis TaxID=392032 RepID=A0A820TV91_9BILA|nr:unnamed protein product [Rotaria socialis]